MIEKIEHIGIAVKNLDEANKIYEQLLGSPPYKMETVVSEGVNTSFFKSGESKVELLEATKDESEHWGGREPLTSTNLKIAHHDFPKRVMRLHL